MKKNLKVFVAAVLAILLAVGMCACDFTSGKEIDPVVPEEEDSTEYTTYYRMENSETDSEKWLMISETDWINYDGTFGSLSEKNGTLILRTSAGIWAVLFAQDGEYIANVDGKSVVYTTEQTETKEEEKESISFNAVFDYAVESGFTGTLEELIEAFSGDSAYEVAVKNGFKGSEKEWLASLVGSTPTIGKNGHWYIDGMDTGFAARGETGNGIASIDKETEGSVDTYTMHMTDGTTFSFTVTNGKDGAAAAIGTGIASIEKIGSEENVDTYKISMTDGSEYTFTVTNGKDGSDGLSMKEIKKTSSEGNVDTYTVTMTDGTEFTYTVVNGKDGKDGKDGTSVPELYAEAVEAGYEGSYLDFILGYTTVEKESTAVTNAMFATVNIRCIYEYNSAMFGAADIQKGMSSGSGIIYQLDKENGDALILTNYHVVYASERYTKNASGKYVSNPGVVEKVFVYLYGSEIIGSEYYENAEYEGQYIEAEYIGGAMNYDLAVLKITGSERLKKSNAVQAVLGDSEETYAGQEVWAIGNSAGDGIALTSGIVNMPSETLTLTGADETTSISLRVIRHDAPVNPGNSGGALVNKKGEVIGIVNAKMVDDEYDNVGYAIPMHLAKNIVENVLYYYQKGGERQAVQVQKLLFGVSYSTSESYAETDEATGRTILHQNLYIVGVNDTSIVINKVQIGDVITAVRIKRGESVETTELIRPYLLSDLCPAIRAGDEVTLVIDRAGEEIEETITITEEDLVIAE